jgi:hypothetical protein
MSGMAHFRLAILFFCGANLLLQVSSVGYAGQQPPAQVNPPAEAVPSQAASAGTNKVNAKSEPKNEKKSRLRPESQLAIIRYVDGEFAKAALPLPSVKQGFRFRVGSPVDSEALRRALASNAAAANTGDKVQITRIGFEPKEIRVDINGGAKKHKRLRDRIHVEMAGGGLPTGRVIQNQTPGIQQIGATLVLDFGGPVPDLTPDELKQYLSPFLDFSHERSAAQNWVDTLPPQFKQAIQEKRAVVGMDREMVLAAMGPAGKKVRSRNEDGVEIEQWIYGQPPEKVIFVTFIGEKVSAVKELK